MSELCVLAIWRSKKDYANNSKHVIVHHKVLIIHHPITVTVHHPGHNFQQSSSWSLCHYHHRCHDPISSNLIQESERDEDFGCAVCGGFIQESQTQEQDLLDSAEQQHANVPRTSSNKMPMCQFLQGKSGRNSASMCIIMLMVHFFEDIN